MSASRDVRAREAGFFVVIGLFLATQTPVSGFGGGTGEPNNPYQIVTADHLLSIGSDPHLLDRHYVLVADIDLTDYTSATAIIAPDMDDKAGFDGPAFTGTFDGRGHRISGLTLDAGRTGNDFLGLFGRLGGNAKILYLGIEGAVVIGGQAVRNIGVLAGDNDGLIHQCYATGTIAGGDWSDFVGGLVGSNTGTASQCYALTDLTGGPFSNLAGLAGSNAGVLHQCYAAGAVSRATFGNSGGLVISNTGLLAACYFLHAADGGGPDNGLGVALTDAEMKDTQQLAGFAFFGEPSDGRLEAWIMPDNAYPVLAWQTDITGLVWLPGVRGMSLDEARGALEDAGLIVVEATHDFDSLVPAGGVVSVIPARPVLLGTEVSVLVSDGAYDWRQNSGQGTEENPYTIGTAGQLDSVGRNPALWTKHFVLTASLDMTGRLYHDAVIGAYRNAGDASFTGSLDGGRFEISGLTIISAGDYVGLFGYLPGSFDQEIRNLILTNAYILARSAGNPGATGGTGLLAGSSLCALTDCSAHGSVIGLRKVGGLVGHNQGVITRCLANTDVSGMEYLGGLAGHAFGGVLSLCHTRGTVRGTHENIGGLAGYIANSCRITRCFATADVSGLNRLGGLAGYFHTGAIDESLATGNVTGNQTLGGLVGYADSPIHMCCATGRVSGGRHVGGLVGYGRKSLTQCYATGATSGDENVGGLVGFLDFSAAVDECYAAGAVAGTVSVGGLLGYMTAPATIANCFWDVEASGIAAGAYGTPLTTVQMQIGSTFKDAGWDFAQTWTICEGKDYPRFVWEAVACE